MRMPRVTRLRTPDPGKPLREAPTFTRRSHGYEGKAFRARPIGATYEGNVSVRRAIGYVRVSTDMQAQEGISLEAQQAAIQQYCFRCMG